MIRVAIAQPCTTARQTTAVLARFSGKPHYSDIALDVTPTGWIVKATRPASRRELRKLHA